jgi:hypothetical protein
MSKGYTVNANISKYNWGDWDSDGNQISGSYHSGWSVHTFDASAGRGFIFSLKAEMFSGRAMGIVFGYDSGGNAVILDFEKGELLFTSLSTFFPTDKRKMDFHSNQPYNIRIVSRGEFHEVYIDDVLWQQVTRDSNTKGYFGLYVENGSAVFKDIVILSLETGSR